MILVADLLDFFADLVECLLDRVFAADDRLDDVGGHGNDTHDGRRRRDPSGDALEGGHGAGGNAHGTGERLGVPEADRHRTTVPSQHRLTPQDSHPAKS
ncbi:hypothetical protein [Nonomuraea sp. NPDC003214]